MKKQGFTLAEVVVALGIAAAIAVVIMPMFPKIKPNKELLMFRKAYYRIENAIIELVNDDNLYPEPEGGSGGYLLSDARRVYYRGGAYSGGTKFCGLLAAKLGAETINCSAAGSERGFTTPDGIKWRIPPTSFVTAVTISIDVNGDKAPNCSYSRTPIANTTQSATCTKPDTFEIKVFPDGRIVVPGQMEKEYLLRKDTTQDAKFETMTLRPPKPGKPNGPPQEDGDEEEE